MTDLPGIIFLSLRVLLAIVLYLFLGFAIRIIWQDLRQTKTTSEQKTVLPLQLNIDAGPQGIVTHFLINPENILGRGSNCDINLANETVSSIHARIFYEHKQWWLEDLGSSNGTFLNDIPVDQPAVLADKDSVRFGQAVVEIRLTEDDDLGIAELSKGK